MTQHNDNTEAMREAFEKFAGLGNDEKHPIDGYYLDQTVRLQWFAFKRAWQAALSTQPRVTEEEEGDICANLLEIRSLAEKAFWKPHTGQRYTAIIARVDALLSRFHVSEKEPHHDGK